MIEKKSWQEFRDTGLMLFVNQILHIFGWALVFNIEDEKVTSVYPARVKFRGFDEKSTTEAYEKISKYMVDNSEAINNEIKEN